jgi:uncharacterized protein
MVKVTSHISQTPIVLITSRENPTSEGQCDCACAEVIPKLDTYHSLVNGNGAFTAEIQRERFIKTGPFHPVPIDEEFLAVLSPNSGAVVLNSAAVTIAEYFRSPQFLYDLPASWYGIWGEGTIHTAISSLVECGLLQLESKISLPITEAPTVLTAWLHITDRCNLRCAYCYLPHKSQDMTPDIGLRSIQATIRSALEHKYQQVKFKFAGGEPLLRFPLVAQLQQFAQQLAQQNDLLLDSVVLSNGTMLSTEIVSKMKKLGIRLMISLDGIGMAHDTQRFYANGHGTFDDVVRGVENALSLNLIPDISVTVTGRNAGALAETVQWILEKDLPFSLNFYRENDFSISRTNLILDEEKITNGMLAAFDVIEANLPRRSLLSSLIDRANLTTPHARTCGVGNSYLVFDYHGHISKCQMHMNQSVADINAGDPLLLIREDTLGIQNLSVEVKSGCRECDWKFWCTGGCPLTTFRATGRYDIQSPNCNIYKTLYPKAVRLEGLRLLREAGLN